jgi:uncharacterized DUF497 family protein
VSIAAFDPDHSQDEDRYITVGISDRGRVIMVARAHRGNRTRNFQEHRLRIQLLRGSPRIALQAQTI